MFWKGLQECLLPWFVEQSMKSTAVLDFSGPGSPGMTNALRHSTLISDRGDLSKADKQPEWLDLVSCKACFIFFLSPALFLTTQLLTLHRRWKGAWVLRERGSLEMLNCAYGLGGPNSARGGFVQRQTWTLTAATTFRGQWHGPSGEHAAVIAQGIQERAFCGRLLPRFTPLASSLSCLHLRKKLLWTRKLSEQLWKMVTLLQCVLFVVCLPSRLLLSSHHLRWSAHKMESGAFMAAGARVSDNTVVSQTFLLGVEGCLWENRIKVNLNIVTSMCHECFAHSQKDSTN